MQQPDARFFAKHCGLASIDFIYSAEQELILNDGSRIFAQIQEFPTGNSLYTISTSSIFSDNDETAYLIEKYDTLQQTSKSQYHQIFQKLNKFLRGKIKENLDEIDDTKYSGGVRFGAHINGKEFNAYTEGVVYLRKSDKYIYLQVRKINEHINYSITESSIFMRMDMGELYYAYFGRKADIPFVINTDDLHNLGEYEYLKPTFDDLTQALENKIK